jgi:hypothetical protein
VWIQHATTPCIGFRAVVGVNVEELVIIMFASGFKMFFGRLWHKPAAAGHLQGLA